MVFRKALLRELATVALGTFLVLLGITLTTQLVRFLGQAASGAITSAGVAALLGFTMLSYLPVLLSITLWAWIWGAPGALLGVPLTMTIIIVCRQFERTRWVAVLLSDDRRRPHPRPRRR